MEKSNVILNKLTRNQGVKIVAVTTLTAEGATVSYMDDCQRIMLIIGGAEATIKKGDSIQATQDLVIPFATGETKAVVVESGKYKHMTGMDKGNIVITGVGATVQAFLLP